MKDSTRTLALTAFLALGTALPAAAVTTPAGDGGFDDGWATRIYYDPTAERGRDRRRHPT